MMVLIPVESFQVSGLVRAEQNLLDYMTVKDQKDIDTVESFAFKTKNVICANMKLFI